MEYKTVHVLSDTNTRLCNFFSFESCCLWQQGAHKILQKRRYVKQIYRKRPEHQFRLLHKRTEQNKTPPNLSPASKE